MEAVCWLMDGPSRNTLKLSSSKHVRKSREVETDYAPERMGVPVRRSRRRSRSWDSNDSDLEESRRRKNSSRRSEDLKFGEDNYGFEDRSDKGSRKHRRRSLSRSRSSRRSRIKRSRSSSRLRKKHREYRRRSRSRSRERRRRRRSSSRSRRSRRSSSSSISRSPESKPSNFSSNPIQTANFSAPVGSSSFGTGMPISNIAMSSTLPQVTKQARRLYVGSLPMSMPFDEQFLLQYFTTVVQQLGVITPTPIISVWISADRSFCVCIFASFFFFSIV